MSGQQRRQRCSAACGNLVHMGRLLCEPCAGPTGKPWEPRSVWGQMRKAAREEAAMFPLPDNFDPDDHSTPDGATP